MKIKCEDCIHSEVCGIKDKEEMNCLFHILESNTAIVIPHKGDKHYTVICFREMMDNKGNVSKACFKMPNVNVAFDILSEEKTGDIFTMTVME